MRAPASEAVLAPDEDGVAHGLLGRLGDPAEGTVTAERLAASPITAPARLAATAPVTALIPARLPDQAPVQRPRNSRAPASTALASSGRPSASAAAG